MSEPYFIYVAVPNAGSIKPCCMLGTLQATQQKHQIHVDPSQFGDIEHNFNMCFCNALNMRPQITHFAMIHTDIKPMDHWLDTLLDEMDRVDADIMTTVIPIKDDRGLTTTGIRYPGIWGTRRLTMHEIVRLPATFSIEDTDEPDGLLAINTGLWVCRFPESGWPDRFPGFTCKHKIAWDEGKPQANFDSEDWLFSDWAASQGLKVFATRRVQCSHEGAVYYPNNKEWGAWPTELQRAPRPLPAKLKALPDPNIEVITEKPVALDSFDHTNPLGTAFDNHWNPKFNHKLYSLTPADEVRLLDLGCSGGRFVRSILEDGGFAIGIEGSDFSKRFKRAEWTTIPKHLFTADATEPFTVRNCSADPVQFNILTAWEFFEHIKEGQLWAVVDNIKRHLEPGGYLIGSISSREEDYHKTVKPREWWYAFFRKLGFSYLGTEVESFFGNDMVRRPENSSDESFPVFLGLDAQP